MESRGEGRKGNATLTRFCKWQTACKNVWQINHVKEMWKTEWDREIEEATGSQEKEREDFKDR